jgi:hypothetical protein
MHEVKLSRNASWINILKMQYFLCRQSVITDLQQLFLKIKNAVPLKIGSCID